MDAANALPTCAIVNPFRVTKFRGASSKIEPLMSLLHERQTNAYCSVKVCCRCTQRRRTSDEGSPGVKNTNSL
jgi:hypothetical protein